MRTKLFKHREKRLTQPNDPPLTLKKADVAEPSKGKALPTGRLKRLAKVARMATGVAGGMLAEGTRQLKAGNVPRPRDMLLTPGNARRVAKQLADMRGAAMKFGQLLSMDSGELLPKELANILATLRAQAQFMPAAQLEQAMQAAYGNAWRKEFSEFNERPIAAASIGQVHSARTHDGQHIVLKVQYPGIAKSIDSDIDNIAMLLRISGLVPTGIDLTPLLDDAKIQLKDETNYKKEARYLTSFTEALQYDQRYCIPTLFPSLSRSNVLAMSFVEGEPIEQLVESSQSIRNEVMIALFELMLSELFELRMMQTDPNFANYLYNATTEKVVLLDFGATRKFKARFIKQYLALLKAALANDEAGICNAAEKIGYGVGDVDSPYRQLIIELFIMVLEPARNDRPYDFAASDLPARLAKLGDDAKQHVDFWRAPPADSVYIHRKVGGMFLLASRLKAKVNLNQLMQRWLT
jgi:predicted unusual protein kinase regulating ubiquinone biosynthesis (AarF/ABC1/UbiB family)